LKIGKSAKNYADFTKKKVKNCQKEGLARLTLVKLHKDYLRAFLFHKMDIKVVHDGFQHSTSPVDSVGREWIFRD
jgi:hypothetical protein